MKRKATLLLITVTLLLCAACTDKATDDKNEASSTTTAATESTMDSATEASTTVVSEAEQEETMEVTVSSTTADRRLLTKCAATSAGGENLSPEISWAPVDGAVCYAVYMIDSSASNWLHMNSGAVSETSLALGALDEKHYVGPYPPGGEHTYEITVYALKKEPESFGGYFDNSNGDLAKITDSLDIVGGESGNIIIQGTVSTLYAYGDNNV